MHLTKYAWIAVVFAVLWIYLNPINQIEKVPEIVPDPSSVKMDQDKSDFQLHVNPHLRGGYRDGSFEFDIVHEQNDSLILVETSYPRYVQYTLSNIDGSIIRRRRFKGSDTLNLTGIDTGHYALYFFVGSHVVQADLISID